MKYCSFIVLTFLFSALVALKCYGQKESNVWIFGYEACIDFNNGKAAALAVSSHIAASEGCASVCDTSGQLLFYTDGMNVWNRDHAYMSNGTALHGNISSTQSSLIIRQPGSYNLYYVFTNDCVENLLAAGLNYYIVDMNANSGLGGVIVRDKKLNASSSEKLTATLHTNRKDIWIISHNADGNAYNAYLLTSSGLNTTPVQSYIGGWYSSKFNIIDNLGCMAVSPDGSTVANAVYGENKVELLNFNPASGQFKYWFTLNNIFGPYGVGFSPSSAILYVAHTLSNGQILQYNLIAHDTNTIINTVYKLNVKGACGDIQLGPDKKMYCPYPATDSVLVINDPNQIGSTCNPGGLKIKGKVEYGLPNIPQSYFSSNDIGYSGVCSSDSVYFYLLGKTQIDSITWDFGDTKSSANTSKSINPAHLYSSSGSYIVRATSYKKRRVDTFSKVINLFSKPRTIDTTFYLCAGKGATINIDNPAYTYQWNDHSSKGLYNVNKAGKYWVNVNNASCYTADTFRVLSLKRPALVHITDTTVCNANNFTLNVNLPTATYTWQDGNTQPVYTVNKDGIYKVIIAYQCGTDTDIFKVKLNQKLRAINWHDTSICEDDSIVLNAGQAKATYKWQDGSTLPTYTVKKDGFYAVTINSYCDSIRAGASIRVIKKAKALGWKDTGICASENFVLSAKQAGFSYLWQDGSGDSTYIVSSPGIYWLQMSGTCGTHTDTMHVKYEDCTLYLQIPNVFSPDGNGINDVFKAMLSRAPKEYDLSIYNRWGQVVFHTNDYTQGWDGNCYQTPALEGVYKYILNVNGYRHEDIHRSGTVMLLRN